MKEEHTADCRWQLTTEQECEYRATHYYCPHPEHACTCSPEVALGYDALNPPRYLGKPVDFRPKDDAGHAERLRRLTASLNAAIADAYRAGLNVHFGSESLYSGTREGAWPVVTVSVSRPL